MPDGQNLVRAEAFDIRLRNGDDGDRLSQGVEDLQHATRLFALPMGGQIFLVINFFFYGDRAAAAAAQAKPLWSAWMNERFPMPAGDPETA